MCWRWVASRGEREVGGGSCSGGDDRSRVGCERLTERPLSGRADQDRDAGAGNFDMD